MSRISIIKIVLCFLIIIINGCFPAISAENLPLESAHPYANSSNKTWTVSEPGAAKIRLHFEYLKLEKSEQSSFFRDKLILYDKYGNELETYIGSDLENQWTDWCPGDTIQVKLETDSSGVSDGFIIDKKGIKQEGSITNINNSSPVESDHPYQNDYEDDWSISKPGAAKIRLHFAYLKLAKRPQTTFYFDDTLTLYDKYGNEFKTYLGSDEGLSLENQWTDWCPGDTIQVKFKTDFIRVCDGFVIDKIEGSNETSISSENVDPNSPKTVEPTQTKPDSIKPDENKVLTTTTLTSLANPSEFEQSVTLTAKVDAPSQAVETPSGTVTFMDGTTSIGSEEVVSGQATLRTSKLSSGSHSITAEYSGDNNFEPSTSSSFPLTVQDDNSNPSVQDDNSNPSVQDDNSNPSDHPDYTLVLNNIDSILGIIGTIVTIIVAKRKFL